MGPEYHDLRIVAMVAIFANIIFSLLLIYSADIGISGKLIGVVLGMWYAGMVIFYLYHHSYLCALFIGLSAILIPVSRIFDNLVLNYLF